MSKMEYRTKIYVEQLREGHIEEISESFAPEFLDVSEDDLDFSDPIEISGEAYVADDMLVLHLNATTYATIPCRICNDPVKVEVAVNGFYHAEPLAEIKTGVFDFHEVMRETILLEVPSLVECHQGKCPQRLTMQKFFKKESEGEGHVEDGYQPFADLDLNKTTEKKKKK